MSSLTLIIGNKNYSSWSMRPWLVLRQAGIDFKEVRIPLYQENSREQLLRWSPSGLVPALHHGQLRLWDSLAIAEYINEMFPEKNLWPRDRAPRAVARSISAEMHAGFSALRHNMPMNCRSTFPGKGLTTESRADIERITALWRQCRVDYGADGALLFGHFTIADAMYAPVTLRFKTYGVPLDPVCAAYVDAVASLPAVVEWVSAGQRESERLPAFEPYTA